MNRLTAEEIVKQAEAGNSSERAITTAINSMYRQQDESHLWPISGEFNVTERAVRHVREFERLSDKLCPLGYALAIDAEMSRLVNDEKNWSCNKREFYEREG